MAKDFTRDWNDWQREFWHVLTQIVENDKYTDTMNHLIYSYWKPGRKDYFLPGENEIENTRSDAWDVLRELNERMEDKDWKLAKANRPDEALEV